MGMKNLSITNTSELVLCENNNSGVNEGILSKKN